MVRRNRLTIMADLCQGAREEILKTQLMNKANLNIDQIQGYLGLLLKLRLIQKRKVGRRIFYKTTDKGIRYLENFDKMIDFLQQMKGDKDFEDKYSMLRIRSNIRRLKRELRELERNLDLVDTCPHCGKKISKAS